MSRKPRAWRWEEGLQPRLSGDRPPLSASLPPRAPAHHPHLHRSGRRPRRASETDGVVAGAFLSQEPWLQGGDSESFTSMSPRRRQLVHHTPLPAAWSHCLEGSKGPWGSDGCLCPFKTLVSGPRLRVTPARRLEPRPPGAGEDLVLQKGSRSGWLGVLAAQKRCRGTLLSLGLGAEAHVLSLACWLLSWGAQRHRPRDPAHGHRPHPAQLLPTLRTGTGGCPPDPSAPQRPKHGHGPAVLGDGCQVGETVPAGSQAPGFRQERRAPCPQPADLPHLQPTASQSPAGPLCQPSLSVGLPRSHPPGALPREPCPPPPLRSPRSTSVLGTDASGATWLSRCLWVLWLRRPRPPAPAGTVSPWPPCNLDDKLRTPSKYCRVRRCTAAGPRGMPWSDRRFRTKSCRKETTEAAARAEAAEGPGWGSGGEHRGPQGSGVSVQRPRGALVRAPGT